MKTLIVICFIFIFSTLTLSSQYEIPAYLKGYEKTWASAGPKAASLKWFRDAQFGMFIHFSPASSLQEPIGNFQKTDTIWQKLHAKADRLDQYSYKRYLKDKFETTVPAVQALFKTFNPSNFNAEEIADLAMKAGMKYITFTTQHVIGQMFMFNTSVSERNSMRYYNRDFVAELSAACQKRGLGLFLYVMPPFDLLQDELHQMMRELLTNYGPIAGIWWDGIWHAYNRPTSFIETSKLYSLVNDLQPQCLNSFKTGLTGDEDFLAPEWHQIKFNEKGEPVISGTVPLADKKIRFLRRGKTGLEWRSQAFSEVWEKELRHKPIELSTTMIKGNKWFDDEKGIHKTVEEIMEEYKKASANKTNYLLNVAPRGDGSLHPEDVKALQALSLLKHPVK
jgi:alpha-L-fucosidase